MQLPRANRLQDLAMSASRSSGLNPLVRDALCKMEHALAVAEHRGASLLEIEPASINFAEMRQQICFEGITRLNELPHSDQQIATREGGEPFFRHDIHLTRDRGEVDDKNNICITPRQVVKQPN